LLLQEARARQIEAEKSQVKEEPKPVAAAAVPGSIDWRAKAEERRIKEMERKKETDFPTLGQQQRLAFSYLHVNF
jgi:hypothetical protein